MADGDPPRETTSDRPAKQALSAAVRANDSARVASVLEQYPELRTQLGDPLVPDYHFGATPLLAAVHHQNRDMIDALLSAGADINARSHWWAGGFGVLDGHPELAPFLIARGARIDAHAASRLGMLDRLREIVAADPQAVHATGGDGQTPLHVAASVEIAAFLVDRGAELDARDVDHESTPAQYMVRDRQDIVRWLVERGCRTDILMLAAIGDLDRVRRHLDRDPDAIRTTVSERDFPKRDPRSGGSIYIWTIGAGKSAHAVAREFGHEDVLQALLASTPPAMKLAVACDLEDEAAVDAAIASAPGGAAALDASDRERIAIAARNDRLKAVSLMLKAGWPVDVRGQHGGTPLHWAAWNGNAAMVQALLDRGAPLDIVDHDFEATPLGWAIYGSVHGWKSRTGDYGGAVERLLSAGAGPVPAAESTQASDAVLAVLRRASSGPGDS